MIQEQFNSTAGGEILQQFGSRPELLVQILHAFMVRFGCISDAACVYLAEALNVSRADVHGVVSYYHDFRREPAAPHVVKICAAEACQAMGSRALMQHASKSLQLAMHESNELLTLEPVYCLGNCACSPAVMVDGKTYGKVSTQRFDEIIAALPGSSS